MSRSSSKRRMIVPLGQHDLFRFTALAPVGIRRILGLGHGLDLLCFLRFVFSLNFKFWCLISYDLQFYHIIYYHPASITLSTVANSQWLTTSYYTYMIYYLSHTYLNLSITPVSYTHLTLPTIYSV